MMASLWSGVNRWLVWFHRWAGVVLCLLFAMWFASGAVLHFIGFPALSAADATAAAEPIDFTRLLIDPATALSREPRATDLRLLSVAGRPFYIARLPSGDLSRIAGDTGEMSAPFPASTAKIVAEKFAGAPAAGVAGPLDYDQWIVHQHFDPYRPFYRVRLQGDDRTDLYVSARSGEVLQRTGHSQRAWNWIGAVIHWIYFTPLRRSWSAWNQVVWWLSLAALLSACAGTWLGVVRFAANRAAARPGISPFRGWMRWHHVIGLFASITVLAWMLSGWLSMDHGRLFSRGEASEAQSARMRGMTLGGIARAASLESLHALGPATLITFNAVAGRAFATGFGPLERRRRVAMLDAPGPHLIDELPDALLLEGVRCVWPSGAPAFAAADDRDQLYRLAESIDGSTAALEPGGGQTQRIFVDRHTGRLLAVMDDSRKDYAWIYYALHTLQFPGLIAHPGLRTASVLGLLALGFAASVTGVVLSVKRLRRGFPV